jgi:hypothetical protein
MTEFEIGDRVRYTNAFGTIPELKDKTATVKATNRVLNQLDVVWDEPNRISDGRDHAAECFEKIEPAAPETTRESVLREASQLIHGDRNLHYGEPTDNFQTIATIWTALLSHKLKDGEVFTASDVADFSIGIKLARNKAGRKRDNYTDIVGYAACGEECREAEEK